MSRFLTMVWLVAGCGPGTEATCDDGADNDGDGFVDCADQDCWGGPVCGEACDNGRDDDGDGAIDCSDPDCADACSGSTGDEVCDDGTDDDGDWLVDCMDPDCAAVCDGDADGWIATAAGGLDCDDADPAVHPEALEVPYDGADNDCDPTTPDDDLDGDGVVVESDCDDEAAATYPGAPETCGDGVVNDCDASGTPPRDACYGDRSVGTADAILEGTAADDWTGYSVAGAGDVNGDGFGDLIIGAYGEGSIRTGAAYLVHGPLTGALDMSQAAVKWTGESEDDWAGFTVAAGGDLTGNGVPDLLIGARYDDATGHNAGATYVVRADATGTIELSGAVAKILAEEEYDSSGFSVAGVGDVDGDGNDDVLVGSVFNSEGGSDAGAAYVVFGPILGTVQLNQSDYKLVGARPSDNTGCAVGDAGDVDGDGQRDVLFGACLADLGGENAGVAYLFTTHTLGTRDVNDADGLFVGKVANDQAGAAVAGGGDIDGDGLDDVVIGAPFNDQGGVDAGAVYVSVGPSVTELNAPESKVIGAGDGDRAGTSVAVVGDVDGDGHADLAIGAPGSDITGEDSGAAYVLFGPIGGLVDLETEFDVRLQGEAAFDFAGQSVAGAGDVDGDGLDDVVVGAPFRDGAAPSGGAAYLLTFGW
jgi:hypothetical protein